MNADTRTLINRLVAKKMSQGHARTFCEPQAASDARALCVNRTICVNRAACVWSKK